MGSKLNLQPSYFSPRITSDIIHQPSYIFSEDTVVVGGVWNGRVNTYTVLDELHVFLFDQIYADFYGTPGAFDDKLLDIRSEKVAYLGSLFASTDKRVMEDRFFIGRLRKILRMHRSREWKKEQIFQFLTAFDASDYR